MASGPVSAAAILLGFGRKFNINLELNIGYAQLNTERAHVRSYGTLGIGIYRY